MHISESSGILGLFPAFGTWSIAGFHFTETTTVISFLFVEVRLFYWIAILLHVVRTDCVPFLCSCFAVSEGLLFWGLLHGACSKILDREMDPRDAMSLSFWTNSFDCVAPHPTSNCDLSWTMVQLHGLLALCSTAPVVDQSRPCVLAPVTYMASYLLVACEVCCVAGAGSLSPTNGLGGLWISCWWAKNGPISFVFRMAAFCWL
jgi:hypothetical protein